MTENSEQQITSVDQLRKLLAQPHELTRQKIHRKLDPQMIEFLTRSPLIFIATSDPAGLPTVSPKGDPTGFISVVNGQTLHVPERPGNKLLHSFENILSNPKLGLIALVPGMEETLRISGDAKLLANEKLNERYAVNGKPALLVVEIKIERCFFHCAKAFKRSRCWQPEHWPDSMKISFGQSVAANRNRGRLNSKAVETAVNIAVDRDYKNNLY